MPNIKTAISLEQSLFQQVDELACSLKISRSRVFALAAEELFKRRHSDALTHHLHAAYPIAAGEEDQEILRQIRGTHRRLAEAEW